MRLFGRLSRRGSGPGRPRYATHVFEPGGDLYATAAADEWPEDWLQAIVIPLWKNKGNWRGISFLSEVQKSSLELSLAVCKILGNIYGRRATRVSENRSVDDIVQITRRFVSPPLFSLYHQAVLCDFRARRKRKAEEQGWSPGVPWKVIVDDRLQRSNEERQTSRHQQKTLLQDVEFADDTVTIAMEQEFPQADRLLDQTFLDWNEKLNRRDKTETWS